MNIRMKIEVTTSLAAKGALAYRLQHRTACKIKNGRQGAAQKTTTKVKSNNSMSYKMYSAGAYSTVLCLLFCNFGSPWFNGKKSIYHDGFNLKRISETTV